MDDTSRIRGRGTIAVLDALGVGRFDLDRCEYFLESRNRSIDKAVEALNAAQGVSESKFGSLIQPYYELVKPITLTFGDTILFAWPEATAKRAYQLGQIGLYLASIHNFLFHRGIFLRGAVGFGEFIFEPVSNSIIGPAVAAAATVYDKHKMLGIIYSPEGEQLVDQIESSGGFTNLNDPIAGLFSKYDVPFKERQVPLWVVGWPYVMQRALGPELLAQRGFSSVSQAIESKLENHSWSDDSLDKKRNTIAFVHHCLET